MIARAPLWLLVAALVAAPMPLAAQDKTPRPLPRPVAATAETLGVKPAPRPAGLAAAPTNSAPTNSAPAKLAAPRPQPRPASISEKATAPIRAVSENSPALGAKPKPRPTGLGDTASAAPAAGGGLARSPRPKPRPQALLDAVATLNAAMPTAPAAGQPGPDPAEKPTLLQLLFGKKSAEAGAQIASAEPAPSDAPRKGSVCGDRAIRGEKIKPITSSVKGCGVPDAVRVTEVAGIKLSQAVTVECGTVTALKQWIDSAMRPAFGNREVVQLRIAAHYACRGRNNKKGARISEHGKGKALDISGFIFADGSEWTIRRDYNKQIRKAHKGACGIFGTTLGPGSDGYHEDHLHFDTARYRAGTYCR